MRTSETISVLLFVGIAAGIFVAAAGVCVTALIRRLRHVHHKKDTLSRRRRWIRRIVLAAAVAGIGCGAYGYFIEPYWPEVTHVEITSAKLPAGTRPIRIVHISDLHCDPTVRLENRLPDLIAAQNPDLIVFTGDAANSTDGLPVFAECITRIAAIAPTYAVAGNWDAGRADLRRVYQAANVTLLEGQVLPLTVGDTTIRITGASFAWGRNLDGILTDEAEDHFTLMLYHTPDLAREIDLTGVDLFCAGHTHGGQVALPLFGPLVTLTRHGDGRGRYQIGDTTGYVNRGIGMEGGHAPRVRFWSRPEVTVYEIRPAE